MCFLPFKIVPGFQKSILMITLSQNQHYSSVFSLSGGYPQPDSSNLSLSLQWHQTIFVKLSLCPWLQPIILLPSPSMYVVIIFTESSLLDNLFQLRMASRQSSNPKSKGLVFELPCGWAFLNSRNEAVSLSTTAIPVTGNGPPWLTGTHKNVTPLTPERIYASLPGILPGIRAGILPICFPLEAATHFQSVVWRPRFSQRPLWTPSGAGGTQGRARGCSRAPKPLRWHCHPLNIIYAWFRVKPTF